MSKLEIEYPVISNILIEYLMTMTYPIHKGSETITFSMEPYWGKGSKPLEIKVPVPMDVVLDKVAVEEILSTLRLSLDNFEQFLLEKLVYSK